MSGVLEVSETDAVELSRYYATMRGERDFSVTAIAGKEGNRETFVTKISFADLIQHFKLIDTENAPDGVTLQRELAMSRSRLIKKYIVGNDDFVFPSLIAIVEAIEVVRVDDHVVKLMLKAEAFRYLVDGQGRLIGIEGAVSEDSELCCNFIDIKFIVSEGVTKDAQVFTDVNKTPTSPNASQCIAMDSRMALSTFSKTLVKSIPELNGRVDFTKASVTNRKASNNIWTLNQVSKFILMLTGATPKTADTLFENEDVQAKWIEILKVFFSGLGKHKDISLLFANGCGEWSEKSVVPTAVFFKSLAIFLKVALMNAVGNEEQLEWTWLDKLQRVDLSIDNDEWLGRCLNFRLKFEDKAFNHKAVASYLCKQCDLEVPDELLAVEEEVLISRASMLKAQREAKQTEMPV